MLSILTLPKTSYDAIQRNILAGVVYLNYSRMNASLVRNLKREREWKLSGDERNDSPDHNGKYVTYLLMDQKIN